MDGSSIHGESDRSSSTPQCRTCTKTLDFTLDLQKTRPNWWTNCKGCRTARTETMRRKRESSRIESTKSQPVSAKRHAPAVSSSTLTSSKKTASYKYRTVSSGRSIPSKKHSTKVKKTHQPSTQPVTGLKRRKEEDIAIRKNETLLRDYLDVFKYPEDTECSVCAETLPLKDFSKLSACTHEPNVCKDCFLTWLNSEIDCTTWESIQCPSSGCKQSITHADVKKHASEEAFTRFDELSVRAFLSNDTDFQYCQAEGCSSGQIHDTSTDGYIFRCTACGYRMCTTCEVPFHTDETCTQYQERIEEEEAEREEELRILREQEEASAAEVKASSVECPGCGANIAKISGCDHMTYAPLVASSSATYVEHRIMDLRVSANLETPFMTQNADITVPNFRAIGRELKPWNSVEESKVVASENEMKDSPVATSNGKETRKRLW